MSAPADDAPVTAPMPLLVLHCDRFALTPLPNAHTLLRVLSAIGEASVLLPAEGLDDLARIVAEAIAIRDATPGGGKPGPRLVLPSTAEVRHANGSST